MLGLPTGIKISISSKSGHSTFVLSTIDIGNISVRSYPTRSDLVAARCSVGDYNDDIYSLKQADNGQTTDRVAAK